MALVTGASSGIGRATALALVGAGFAVVGTSRNAVNAEPLAGVTFSPAPKACATPTPRTLSRR
ncbi:UNVERIFIED_CONTAM: NAD(P)-dependent dehydrogenase (short-subunit alcohol dehydrogenase family) [Streptomyces canus]